MKWVSWFLIPLSLIVVWAQDVVKPESVGLSTERLARITAFYETEIKENRLAGVNVLIARNGEIAYFESLGDANKESKAPMTADTIFRWASMSKMVTAVGALMLLEQGKIFLDDPVSKYIPEFADPKVIVLCEACEGGYRLEPARRQITLRHLFTHTSGLAYRFSGNAVLAEMYQKAEIYDGIGVAKGTLGEMCARLGKLPLAQHPGERYYYGLSIDVLGRVIEVVSGQDLATYLDEHLFQPLGMVDTYFYVPKEKQSRVAAAYAHGPTGLAAQPKEQQTMGPFVFDAQKPFHTHNTHFSGGGGLHGTIMDYYRLAAMLLNEGRAGDRQILSPTTISMMAENQIGAVDTDFAGAKRGLGIALVHDRARSGQLMANGSIWWAGLWNTYFHIDFQNRQVAIAMSQCFPHAHLLHREKFQNLASAAVTSQD